MTKERSSADQARESSDVGRAELSLSNELAPLPDWSGLGRHILAEAMRRAVARMEARQAAGTAGIATQAKELS